MTHDELLAKIDEQLTCYCGHPDLCDGVQSKEQAPSWYALRAVAELHKPKEEDGKLWCSHEVCYNHVEFLERNDCDCSYPCPTIQAIEKELQ